MNDCLQGMVPKFSPKAGEVILGLLAVLILIVLLAGCAYQPVVDQPSAAYQSDLAACRAHAQQVAGPGTNAATGAAVGFGLGYLICSAMGGRDCSSVGRGVAVAGAASGAGSGAQSEAQIVRNCLAGRGHRVLN